MGIGEAIAILRTIDDSPELQELKDGDRGSYSHFLDRKQPTHTPRVNHLFFLAPIRSARQTCESEQATERVSRVNDLCFYIREFSIFIPGPLLRHSRQKIRFRAHILAVF